MGYIAQRTAAEMYAGEMNITNYDYEDEQGKISDGWKKDLIKRLDTHAPRWTLRRHFGRWK